MIVPSNIPSTIAAFRSLIGARSFQPPNRYLVGFPTIDGQYTIVYPEAIVLPEYTVNTIDDSTFGNKRSIPVQKTVTEVLMSFILLKNWKERILLENWLKVSAPNYETRTSSPYYDIARTIQIQFFDNNNTPTKRLNLLEAYPLSLVPVNFSSESSGYLSFQVVFHVRDIVTI